MSGLNGQFNARLQRLEKMQDSTDGGAVIITDNGTALDKTYAEIYALVESGTPCYIKYNVHRSEQDLDTDYDYNVYLMPVVGVIKYDDVYRVYAINCGFNTLNNIGHIGTSGVLTYQVSASNEYPSFLRRTVTKSGSVDVYLQR